MHSSLSRNQSAHDFPFDPEVKNATPASPKHGIDMWTRLGETDSARDGETEGSLNYSKLEVFYRVLHGLYQFGFHHVSSPLFVSPWLGWQHAPGRNSFITVFEIYLSLCVHCFVFAAWDGLLCSHQVNELQERTESDPTAADTYIWSLCLSVELALRPIARVSALKQIWCHNGVPWNVGRLNAIKWPNGILVEAEGWIWPGWREHLGDALVYMAILFKWLCLIFLQFAHQPSGISLRWLKTWITPRHLDTFQSSRPITSNDILACRCQFPYTCATAEALNVSWMPWKRTQPCRNVGESDRSDEASHIPGIMKHHVPSQFLKSPEVPKTYQNVQEPKKLQAMILLCTCQRMLHLVTVLIEGSPGSRYLGMQLQRLTTRSIIYRSIIEVSHFGPQKPKLHFLQLLGGGIFHFRLRTLQHESSSNIGWQATKHRRKPHGFELPFFSGAFRVDPDGWRQFSLGSWSFKGLVWGYNDWLVLRCWFRVPGCLFGSRQIPDTWA